MTLRSSYVNNLENGRFVRGGSTVTMQAARNLFLNRKKNLARKLEELLLAWLLDDEFEKDELMALYLNVVEFGPNLFGIGDAAEHYFQKKPLELSPGEIGWLVRLLPSPRPLYEHFKKGRLTRGHTRSINRLLRLLVKRGHLSEDDFVELGEDDLWAHLSDEKRKALVESIELTP